MINVPAPSRAAAADADDQGTKVTFWTRLRRHKLAVVSIAVLALVILGAILAPLLHLHDPNAIDEVFWKGDVRSLSLDG